MKYNAPLLTILLWTIGLVALPAWTQSTSDLPIRVTTHRTMDNNLYGWGQDVEIEGIVLGDVSCLSGDVTVSGRIDGNLNVLNGNIYLSRTAEIKGNIVCLGGNITSEAGHMVNGRILNYFKGQSHQSQSTKSFKANVAAFFAKCLFLFLLVVTLFYIFPNQVSEASFQLSQDTGRAFFVGFITLAALIFLLFFSLLLMVVVIGLPLLLLLLCAYTVIAFFGLVVLFFRLALALRGLVQERISHLSSLFIITLIALLLFQLPYVRGILIFGVITMGTGIVIETRFGTNKQWFTRKKRFWAAS